MPNREPARTDHRRTRSTSPAALVVVGAVLVGVLGCQSSVESSAPTRSPVPARPLGQEIPHRVRGADQPGAAGKADGVVPDGVTVFDDEYPAVANLDPELLRALRQAATEAAVDRVVFYVDSGWRSRKYQQQLFSEAVAKYGSSEQAARWVATPGTSAHESGDAVDIGHSDAAAWLSERGSAYGLCPVYRNEPWHYELRPEAVARGCPARFADAAHDPRTQQ